MDVLGKDDIFLRRLWLWEHKDLLLKEAAYHRGFDEEEALPGYTLWRLDEATGRVEVPPLAIL